MAAGLQTHIWNNNLKSLGLLLVYPLILAGVIWGAATVIGVSLYGGGVDAGQDVARASQFGLRVVYEYWPAILAVVAVWFFVSYFLHGRMVRALSHSHPVTRVQEPALYNLLENLCISVGMRMPRLEIIETHARNAFASGIDDKSYCVTVTRGLLQSLEVDELEAVLAHELEHIRNRDVRLMMVCIIFTSMLGFAAQMVWSSVRYSMIVPRSGNRKQGGGIMLLLAIVAILWVGYFATMLTRLAISRRREYMADGGAVKMTKNPEAMMRALMRIAGMADIPKAPGDVNLMCFENTKPFLGMFATHPPIKARIMAISRMTGASVPDIAPKSRASDEARFQAPQARDNWVTRERVGNRAQNVSKNPWS